MLLFYYNLIEITKFLILLIDTLKSNEYLREYVQVACLNLRLKKTLGRIDFFYLFFFFFNKIEFFVDILRTSQFRS
jgi:hypothetical protein